ncbi:MAG TPA: hypothetical protein VJ904_01340, partial [Tichowtungia sp.]|nr:hypothetical protein [Tichowtungia sp.]
RTTAILQTGRNELAFRDGDWKIISTEKTQWDGSEAHISRDALELYNLAVDPYETKNLASRYPERTASMRTHLLELIKAGRSR